MSAYMVTLLLSLIIPLVVSFWPPLRFYSNFKALILSITSITLIFGGWDVLATYRGHWRFSDSGVWGVRIINLPLEEVLFFIVISFCCIFTWESIKYIKNKLS